MTKTLKELENELRSIKLERQIEQEKLRMNTTSSVKKLKKVVKKKSAKNKKKLGFFAPRGNEKEGLDFLMEA